MWRISDFSAQLPVCVFFIFVFLPTGAEGDRLLGMMVPACSLAVVVLNFRTPEITIDCLKTLAPEAAGDAGLRVVLVDNASGDDSVPRIRAAIAENGWDSGWLDFRAFEKNLGFAGGNNAILREYLARPDCPEYLLLLNSDTLVHGGCFEYCRKAMDADPRVGALSCQLFNRDGSVQNVCRLFPRPDREFVRAFGLPWMVPSLFGWADLEDLGWDRKAGARDVEWVGGAFMMLRAKALREAGVLDEGFFFYGEDCELCHRLRKAGWRIRFDPGASIVHLGGASSDGQRMRNRMKDILTWKARFRVQRMCYGSLAEKVSRAAYIVSFALRKTAMELTGRRGSPDYEGVCEGLKQLTGPLEP